MEEKQILDYIKGELTPEQKQRVVAWIRSNPSNQKKFNILKATHVISSFKETTETSDQTQDSFDDHDFFDVMSDKIDAKKSKGKVRRGKIIWYAAATIALLLSTGYFYFSEISNLNNELEIPKEVITLQLNNGDIKVLSDKENAQIVNAGGLVVGTHKGNSIAYENNISEEKLAYNTLSVPYGKRFQVVLSDGTKVHLNAGTSLKYPVKFINGLKREVFLNGEAYFDVTKDTEHPFVVNSNDLNVKVLGTKFNITSYPENELINTVLVEGSVEVFKKDDDLDDSARLVLKPGYKAAWHKENKHINVNKVNIEQYIAWMDGRLILNEISFAAIQKKLERQYNVTFINNNETLKRRKFTARFDIEDIDQVMKSLSLSASFNYSITNNQIIIN